MQPYEPAQDSSDPVMPVPPSAKIIGTPVSEQALPVRPQRSIRYVGSGYSERFAQNSEDRLDYVIDVGRWLEPGETITGVEGYTDPGDMVMDALVYSGTRIMAWITGGNDRSRHTAYVQFVTSKGKLADASFVVATRSETPPPLAVIADGIAAPLTFPVRNQRRLQLLCNQIDRHDKAEPETLDYWLDMTRLLDGDESITAVRVWSDNLALVIAKVRFDDAWLAVWLGAGGYELRSNIRIRITTSRGLIITYRGALTSHGQPQTPVYQTGQHAQPQDIPVNRDRELAYSPCPMPQRRKKNSEEILDYVVNFSLWLEPGEHITGLQAWPDPSSLRISRLLYSDDKAILWLYSGMDGQKYTVQLRVTTSYDKVCIFRFQMLTIGDSTHLVIVSINDSVRTIGQITPATPQPPDPVPVPVAQVTPVALSFPTTIVGATSAAKVLQVTNAGEIELSVRSMAITGPFSYSVEPDFHLAPGASFPVSVVFKPTAVGAGTGKVRLDIGSGLADYVTLTGTGAAETGIQRLSTSGNQFVKPSGAAMRLKSINWFGGEGENYTPNGIWGRAWRGIIDQIKALGFNCIRLPFSGEMATNNPAVPGTAINSAANPDLVGKTALEIFDLIIDYCLAREIYVVLDHHRRTSGAGADGSPIGTSYTLDNWKASWAVMANRYKDKANVVGADLHNEPHDLTWSTWAGYVEDCGNYVHTIAPDWIIFCEGVGSDSAGGYWWGGALGGVATRPVVLNQAGKLAYSPHEYGQSVGSQTWLAYDGQTPPSGWPNNLYAVWQAHWGFIFEQNIAPVWIGEFGGKYGVDGTGTANASQAPHGELEKLWTTTLCDYLNGDFNGTGMVLPAGKQGISFAYWALNPNSGDTGGMLQDDFQTVQQIKRDLINTILAG